MLSNPVASPNDYLPAELQQQHVNLLEDFEIDVGTKKLGDGGSSDVRIINSCHHKKDLYALKNSLCCQKRQMRISIKEYWRSIRFIEKLPSQDTWLMLLPF